VLDAAGGLNRAALAARVFADADARRVLESVLHPPVLADLARWREAVTGAGRDAVGIIPLLFEAQAEAGWTVRVCVSARPEVVQARLDARGWTRAEQEARQRAQWPLAEKENASAPRGAQQWQSGGAGGSRATRLRIDQGKEGAIGLWQMKACRVDAVSAVGVGTIGAEDIHRIAGVPRDRRGPRACRWTMILTGNVYQPSAHQPHPGPREGRDAGDRRQPAAARSRPRHAER
jgi:hypothetical protein